MSADVPALLDMLQGNATTTLDCLFINSWFVTRALLCGKPDEEFENEGGKIVLRREYRKLGPTRLVYELLHYILIVYIELSLVPNFYELIIPKQLLYLLKDL